MKNSRVVPIRRLSRKERFALKLGIDTWQLAAMYAIRRHEDTSKDAHLVRHVGRELQLRHLAKIDLDRRLRLTFAGEAFLLAIEKASRSTRKEPQGIVYLSDVRKVLPA